MPGSSIIRWASAGVAVSAARIASAPKNLNVVICLLRVSTQGAGRQRARLAFAPQHSRNTDHGLAISASLPGLTWQSILFEERFLRRSMDTRVKPAYDAYSKQRRHLPDLDRPQKHRAIDEAQRERPRLLAFQHSLLAERVD